MRHYIELTKPRITWLILMSTGVGYFFGLNRAVPFNWPLLLHTLVGTGLIASGTAALNQWWERESDALMRRTASRPLPMGLLTARQALWFGIGLSLAGAAELALWVNVLSALLGVFTLAAYLFVYTPMKSRTHLSTVVGALPGAMPPLMGYAAASGVLNREAWSLFFILFVWQFPHFLAIAWMYRDDYARAGIRMLPVVEPDGKSTSRQIILYATTLIPISLLPVMLGMSGTIYLVGALVLGLWFLYTGVRVAELVAIRLDDVDLDACRIRITQGKGNKDRVVPFPTSFKETLGLHMDAMRARGADHLFESSWKKPYSTRGVRAMLTRYATLAGIAHPISPHRLRHFLFTWLKTQGIDDALIQPYSGHASRQSLEVYSKIALADAQHSYDQVIDRFPV